MNITTWNSLKIIEKILWSCNSVHLGNFPMYPTNLKGKNIKRMTPVSARIILIVEQVYGAKVCSGA